MYTYTNKKKQYGPIDYRHSELITTKTNDNKTKKMDKIYYILTNNYYALEFQHESES